MLYQIDIEEKIVCPIKCLDKNGNENGQLMYGVYGYQTNNCYLLTPEKETAQQMIKPRTIDS